MFALTRTKRNRSSRPAGKNSSRPSHRRRLFCESLEDRLLLAAGDLDLTFGGGDGIVTTDFVGLADEGRAVALQSDGRILVAGHKTGPQGTTAFALARYTTDGSLDAGFGTGGKVTTDLASGSSKAWDAVIQLDGKIVAAGKASSENGSQFALARYNLDGTLDTSFDKDGKVTTSFPNASAHGFAAALQSDGKIVVAGYSTRSIGGIFAVARYKTNGTLDKSFGVGGRVTIDVGAEVGYDRADGVAVQSDGKIVVAGVSFGHFALVQLNSNGTVDTTFGAGGQVVVTAISVLTFAGGPSTAMATQADGKIVQVGTNNGQVHLARYNPDGSLDTTFDADGIVITPGGGAQPEIAIQSDGKIVVAAGTGTGGVKVLRYNAGGSLDTSFGSGGIAATVVNGGGAALDVAIQGDGKIVAAGSSPQSGGTFSDFAVVRYLGDSVASALKAGIDGSMVSHRLIATPPALHDSGFQLDRTGQVVIALSNSSDQVDLGTMARLHDAVATLNDRLAALDVTLAIGHTGNELSPNLLLRQAWSSPCGSRSDGVLGCATSTGEITIIDGWDWYTGVDPGGVGPDQYDFQTAVTHELLHTLGVERSADPGSVLHATLARGAARRSLTAGDLALPGVDDGAVQPGIRPVREMGREDAPALVVVFDEVLAPTYQSPAAEPVLDHHREVTALARDSGESQTSFAQAAPLARIDDSVLYDRGEYELISGLDASLATSPMPDLLADLASALR